MKANTCTWIALILLSVSSFSLSEAGRAPTAALFILGAAALKACLVGWQFMGLRSAHLAWKVAFPLLLAATLGFVSLLSRIGAR